MQLLVQAEPTVSYGQGFVLLMADTPQDRAAIMLTPDQARRAARLMLEYSDGAEKYAAEALDREATQ